MFDETREYYAIPFTIEELRSIRDAIDRDIRAGSVSGSALTLLKAQLQAFLRQEQYLRGKDAEDLFAQIVGESASGTPRCSCE